MSRPDQELIAAIDKARAELATLRRLDDAASRKDAYPFRDRRSVTDATEQRRQALVAELERLTDELAHIRCARCDTLKEDTTDNRWCARCEEAWALELRRCGDITPNEDRNGVLSWAAPALCLVAVPALAFVASANVGAIVLLAALAALAAGVYLVVPANTPPSRTSFQRSYREQHALPPAPALEGAEQHGELVST